MTGSTKRPPEPSSPQPTGSMDLRIDGVPATVPPGSTVLEACDLAGRYVPRLCTYPEQHCCASCAAGARASSACGPTRAVAAGSGVAPTDAAASAVASVDTECGLCVVRVGDGMVVLACATQAEAGTEIVTDDEGLRRLRLGRLGEILQGHPFVCLLCPDRDGCQRDECSYGNPPEARCCDLYGECELAALVAYVDAEGTLHPSTGPFDREAVTEGPIRREPGLCVGCGRCVVVCEGIEGAGQALRMVAAGPGGRPVAVPKSASLRAAGCTFCGRCVLVCPSGALMAPGDAGARWLERRRLTQWVGRPHPASPAQADRG